MLSNRSLRGWYAAARRSNRCDGLRGGAGARASRADQCGVKFKLDENLSPSLLTMFVDAGHDAHSVGKPTRAEFSANWRFLPPLWVAF